MVPEADREGRAGPLPGVVLVTDWSVGEAALLARLEPLLKSLGPRLAVQHRDPGATLARFFAQGRALAALCAAHRAPLFVSARLDVALALGAHLHLPTHALAPAQVRAHLPTGAWVSVAVHDAPHEVARARGADLALVSPVFPPRSKPSDARTTLGPEGFARLAAQLPCPAYALGGITPAGAALLGAPAGVALMSTVLHQVDDAWVLGLVSPRA